MKNRALQIYNTLNDYYGEVEAELNYENLYQLTIAVVLSAQTTDKQVNSVTPELFKQFPGFQELGEATAGEIEKIIKSTGFYRAKAKNIVALGKRVSDGGGELPRTLEELITLPGIGRKTANVVLSQGMETPGLAVDTHVRRISQRTGLTREKNPDKIEKELKSFLAPSLWLNFHLLLINHGRKLCLSRTPLCSSCPLYNNPCTKQKTEK